MELIVLILLFLLVLTHACRDHKEKEKASDEFWASECREHLRCISNMFRPDCQTITKETLTLYSQRLYRCRKDIQYKPYFSPFISILEQHKTSINDLKKEYLHSVIEKINQRPGFERVTELPSDLAEEYERNIKVIADQFLEIGDYLVINPSELEPKLDNIQP